MDKTWKSVYIDLSTSFSSEQKLCLLQCIIHTDVYHCSVQFYSKQFGTQNLQCSFHICTEQTLSDHSYVTSSYKIFRKPCANKQELTFSSHKFLHLKNLAGLKQFKSRATVFHTIFYAALQTNYVWKHLTQWSNLLFIYTCSIVTIIMKQH